MLGRNLELVEQVAAKYVPLFDLLVRADNEERYFLGHFGLVREVFQIDAGPDQAEQLSFVSDGDGDVRALDAHAAPSDDGNHDAGLPVGSGRGRLEDQGRADVQPHVHAGSSGALGDNPGHLRQDLLGGHGPGHPP